MYVAFKYCLLNADNLPYNYCCCYADKLAYYYCYLFSTDWTTHSTGHPTNKYSASMKI